jgi:hypothetical protein
MAANRVPPDNITSAGLLGRLLRSNQPAVQADQFGVMIAA